MTTLTASDLYYRLSGRASIGSILATVALPCAVIAIASAAYGIIVYLSPIIYVNLLGTLGLGFLSGWLVKKIGMLTRVRRYGVYMTAAAMCGLISIYMAWIGWIFVLSDWQAIVVSPAALFELAGEIGEVGVWSIGRSNDTPVSGIFLYLIWAVEAGVLFVVPVMAAHRIIDEAYCETLGKWLTVSKSFGPFATLEDESGWRAQMEAGDFGVLTALSPMTDELANGSTFTTLTLRHGGEAASTHLLAVDHVTMKLDKQGKVDLKNKPILRNMVIDHETHVMIDEMVTALFPPPQPAADADGEQANVAG